MKITILGTGRIGGTLGKKWAAAGHELIFGTREPGSDRIRILLSDCGAHSRAERAGEACALGDVILFATPWSTVEVMAGENAAELDGKILIDATNRFFSDGPINNLAALSAAAPTATIFRAFNTLGWEVFADPDFEGLLADMVFCGPDGDSRAIVERLISEVGVRPIWLGGNDRIETVDHLGQLWVTLVFRHGWPRETMVKLVSRQDE